MNKKNYSLGVLTAISFIVVSCNLAAQIVTYPIDTANSFSSPSVTPTVVANITAGNLTAVGLGSPADLGFSPNQGYFTFPGWATGFSPDLGKYYDFTITPNAGFQIAFSSVSYTLAGGNPSTYQLRSSVDGFTANFGAHTLTHTTVNDFQNSFTDNVSSLGTQTGAVTFRLYGYNSDGNDEGLANNDANFGGDPGQNLIITGTVSAVPEPHQYGVVAGIGLLAFAFYRRRPQCGQMS